MTPLVKEEKVEEEHESKVKTGIKTKKKTRKSKERRQERLLKYHEKLVKAHTVSIACNMELYTQVSAL